MAGADFHEQGKQSGELMTESQCQEIWERQRRLGWRFTKWEHLTWEERRDFVLFCRTMMMVIEFDKDRV